MSDYFALLGQPRRPWLDAELIKQAFVTAAAEVHPDRIHDAPERTRREAHERYTALNQAHLCLQTPRSRLRHLLELERGGRIRDLQEIPPELMERFTRLGAQLQAADRHLQAVADTASPLLKVRLFEQGERVREGLQQCREALSETIRGLENRLQELNRPWDDLQADDTGGRETILAELEGLYRLMSFHDRWRQQVDARLAAWLEAL